MKETDFKNFTKETFNNRLVKVSISDSQYEIGRVVYETESEGDQDFYVLQNIYDGVPCDIVDPLFKYSYYRDDSMKIVELTEEELTKVNADIEALATLQTGDTVYNKGFFRKVIKGTDGKLSLEDTSHTLDIGKGIIVVKDKKAFLQKLYQKVLDFPYLVKSYKDHITSYINQGRTFNDNVIIEINGYELQYYINSEHEVEYQGLNSYPITFSSTSIDFTPDFNLTVENFDELKNFIKSRFEKVTIFNKSLMSILKNVECDEEVKNKMLGGKFYNNMQFIDYDNENQMITFTPKGKDIIHEKGIPTTKNRQSMKPHKFFNTILKDSASEYDIKCIADKLLAFYNSWTIKYFKGRKFAENYSTTNTRDWSTQSCMDRKAENFFELYTQTPFKLGIIYREGEIVGRFIEVTCSDKFVYNDRLYYKDETVLAWYNSWVDQTKKVRKAKNSQDSKEQFYSAEKGKFTKKVSVTLRKPLDKIAVYPYLDTLAFGYKNKLQNFDSGEVRYQFTSTSGKCSRLRCKLDVLTNKYIDENLAVAIGFGTKSGNYTLVENLLYSAENQAHCLK